MTCEVNPGEAIFLPSFFWHEVTSHPGNEINLNFSMKYHESSSSKFQYTPLPAEKADDTTTSKITTTTSAADKLRLNMAINYWFDPYFNKEFPCKSCRKKFNHERYFKKLLKIM
jgi:hypothetical protein